jgi:hypothetical protein
VIVNNERIVIPGVDTDNHFTGIGLHGVYDSKYDRFMLTKIDYIPTDPDVKYDSATKQFYVEETINSVVIRTQVYLTDPDYFCNKSWTLSYHLGLKSWISFHSYIPNWYIAENNFFYSGSNNCCSEVDADIEAEFQALVGNQARLIPTTTTTSSSTSTTTTTITTLSCNLEGVVIETSCELEGDAIITVPPSTTTTLTLQNNTPGNNVVSQWQSAPSSTGPWTNVGTNSSTMSVDNYLSQFQSMSLPLSFNVTVQSNGCNTTASIFSIKLWKLGT